jgi:hypothetical protein
MTLLNESLLKLFIDRFYGYGNLDAPYWFIGMEEGGGNSLEEISLRLSTWCERGMQTTEDLVDYHLALGIDQFFGEKPRLQSTWAKLIRVLHMLEGKPTTTDAIRTTQGSQLGRSDSLSCLLELLPLPSPSTDQWLYGDHTSLEFLKDRETYRTVLIPKRIDQLRAMIQEYSPKVVMCYGSAYRQHWLKIIQSDVETIVLDKYDVQIGSTGMRWVAMVPHPTATGITNAYFEAVGALLRKRLG